MVADGVTGFREIADSGKGAPQESDSASRWRQSRHHRAVARDRLLAARTVDRDPARPAGRRLHQWFRDHGESAAGGQRRLSEFAARSWFGRRDQQRVDCFVVLNRPKGANQAPPHDAVGSRHQVLFPESFAGWPGWSSLALRSFLEVSQRASGAPPNILVLMPETPKFPPPPEFAAQAHVKSLDEYRALYDRARLSPSEFWGELASTELSWFEKWTSVFDWHPPFVRWFVGGKINVSYNCLDRHLTTHRKNKVAILCEGEPGDQRMITYQELHRLVCRFANVLKARGLKAGDRAIIYMPHDPGAARRAAGLRAARHHPQRGVRRLLRRSAQSTASRTSRPRWSSPPMAAGAAARKCSSKTPSMRLWPIAPACKTSSSTAAPAADPHAGRPRPLVARSRRDVSEDLPRRRAGYRASALRPLHVRHHRQAQGHPAHDRRLSAAGAT